MGLLTQEGSSPCLDGIAQEEEIGYKAIFVGGKSFGRQNRGIKNIIPPVMFLTLTRLLFFRLVNHHSENNPSNNILSIGNITKGNGLREKVIENPGVRKQALTPGLSVVGNHPSVKVKDQDIGITPLPV